MATNPTGSNNIPTSSSSSKTTSISSSSPPTTNAAPITTPLPTVERIVKSKTKQINYRICYLFILY
jgi:hypothetical protein